MLFGKTSLLTVFLEPDNIKLVVSEIASNKATRTYAGQITFPSTVLRDSFIVDSSKFASQIKMALGQKPQLGQIKNVQLVIPPEKTFLKTLDANEDVESFLRSLPYFKEELLLQSFPSKEKPVQTVHMAFEKKLVEELQQPFLDAGKKVTLVTSGAYLLSTKTNLNEDYFLILGLEKNSAVVVHKAGKIVQLVSFANEVFATRFIEFARNNNLTTIKKAQLLGSVSPDTNAKLTSDLGLVFGPASGTDVYDLMIESSIGRQGIAQTQSGTKKEGSVIALPSISFAAGGELIEKIKRILPLAGAMAVGFVLAWVVISALNQKNFGQKLTPVANNEPKITIVLTPTPTPTPTPIVEVKPANFKARVLNGTPVPGEAGKLGNKLVALGYDVIETKNATNSGFTDTKLRVSKDFPAKLTEDLKTLLATTYKVVVVETINDPLVKLEVIIGVKK